ncbi:MAG: acetyl-CoA C-acyltransferase [Alphaproteobacteria bacterium]|nr:acetyl-CoA C-acyltransferase [Alphaproteobacteria bacterium]
MTTVITAAARTPMGGFQGELSGLTAPQLGSAAIAEAIARAKVEAGEVGEVFMGNVLPAGLGQAPARQAALGAGVPVGVPCTTISKVCGSGMRAVMLGSDMIAAGHSEIVVAGGMESMTNAPYLLPKARGGLRLGHGEVKDHMFLDGLEDAREGRLMGTYAEEAAQHYQLTREAQDAYAIESLSRAQRAQASGAFAAEIVPVSVPGKGEAVSVASDEQPRKADATKIPKLKPAFAKDGTVTAANSSSISDGAAALVLMSEGEATRRGAKPLARIVGQASFAGVPGQFVSAPVHALAKLFEKTGWAPKDVDLFEINEAFANVAMIAMRAHDLPHEKVNVNGGACALGHPIGASGARIIVTLLGALEARGLTRGIATLCIGGGEATAVAIERA